MRTLFMRSFAFAVIAAAAGVSCTGTTTVPSSAVSTLSISGSPPSVGNTSQYSAVAVLSDSTTPIDVTHSATWLTDNTAIANVSSTGLVKGVAIGSAKLTATYQGVSASQTISIP